jgi:phage tail-like protein
MPVSNNPYGVFNFKVAIEAVPVAEFSECLLPAVTIEVMEYRQGGDIQSNVHKLPGLVKYGNLVLKRGIANGADSTALWRWISEFVTGNGTSHLLSVTLLDEGKTPVFEWTFTNAWPVKHESPALSGKTNAVAIETLELAVEGMQFLSLGQGT